MVEEVKSETTFCYPGFIYLFEWVVMPFYRVRPLGWSQLLTTHY
jgi:hypothetical protein